MLAACKWLDAFFQIENRLDRLLSMLYSWDTFNLLDASKESMKSSFISFSPARNDDETWSTLLEDNYRSIIHYHFIIEMTYWSSLNSNRGLGRLIYIQGRLLTDHLWVSWQLVHGESACRSLSQWMSDSFLWTKWFHRGTHESTEEGCSMCTLQSSWGLASSVV